MNTFQLVAMAALVGGAVSASSDSIDGVWRSKGSCTFMRFAEPHCRAFDVTGIPSDIAVPVFADEDLSAGRDRAMEILTSQFGAR